MAQNSIHSTLALVARATANATTSATDGDDWRFYQYQPSYALAIVGVVLFGVAFIAHSVYMFKTKSYYMWPFTLGALMESLGYVFRRISAEHPKGRSDGLIWYIIQSLFIILAPALMAASHYMTFGRLISYVGESYSPVRARRVTLTFVIFDVTSFIVQGAGGSLYSSENVSIYKVAKAILIVGFLIQIISFGIFGVFAAIYQVRARRSGEKEGKWTLCLYTLYLGCALILTRGIFRVLEFGTGGANSTGYLLEREAWYYGLETLPILICSYLFLASHPSRYIPSDRSIRLHPENAASSSSSDGVQGGGGGGSETAESSGTATRTGSTSPDEEQALKGNAADEEKALPNSSSSSSTSPTAGGQRTMSRWTVWMRSRRN